MRSSIFLAMGAGLLLVFTSAASGQAIVPVAVSATHIYADTATNRIDMNAENITLQWKDASGVLAEDDHIRITFSAYSDELYWASSASKNVCSSHQTSYANFSERRAWFVPNKTFFRLIFRYRRQRRGVFWPVLGQAIAMNSLRDWFARDFPDILAPQAETPRCSAGSSSSRATGSFFPHSHFSCKAPHELLCLRPFIDLLFFLFALYHSWTEFALPVVSNRSGPGPNDTTLLGMNATFGANCSASFILYLTNVVKTLRIGGVDVVLNPREAKLSVLVNCPWRQSLEYYPGSGVNRTTSAWLVGRRFQLQSRLEFKLSSFISGLPEVRRIAFWEQLSPWGSFISNQCSTPSLRSFDNATQVNKPRVLPSDFDYSATAGFYYATQTLRTGIYFLGWAHSDSQWLTEVRGMPVASDIRFSGLTISAPFDVQMLFAESTLPSAQLSSFAYKFPFVC